MADDGQIWVFMSSANSQADLKIGILLLHAMVKEKDSELSADPRYVIDQRYMIK